MLNYNYQSIASTMTEIGIKIKTIRCAKKLTQKMLAQVSGVNYSTLTKIESGVVKNPSIKTIYKLLNALETQIGDIMGELPKEKIT